jgi:hypothetical protein
MDIIFERDLMSVHDTSGKVQIPYESRIVLCVNGARLAGGVLAERITGNTVVELLRRSKTNTI